MGSSKGTNWLLGCGVGCAGLVVLMVVLGVLGGSFVRDTMSGFDRATESAEVLEQEQGPAEGFVPSPDGAVAPERMEIFLAVRDETQPAREGIESFFAALPWGELEARELEERPFFEKMGKVAGITKAAFGFAGDLGELFATRNEALATRGMGLGEYTYIYVLAYHSWLRHPLDDGPGQEHSSNIQTGRQMASARTRIQRDLITIFSNQVAAIESSDRPDLELLRSRLAREVEALEESRWQVPWEDGVPEAVARSFEPYRSRLEASYSATTNPFELGEPEQRRGFSVTVR